MATYYIAPTGNDSSGSGTYASPWKTMEKAHEVMSSGDTCILKNGVYLLGQNQGIIGAKFAVNKANTTWKAETTHGAIIRGNWGPWLLSDVRPPLPADCGKPAGFFNGRKIYMPRAEDYLPGNGDVFRVNVPNVTVDGIVIECVAGGGFTIEDNPSGVHFKDCITYWTKDQGINCYPGGKNTPESDYATDVTIENCKVIFASCGTLDVHYVCRVGGAKGDPASGAIRVGNCKSSLITGCEIGFSWGEGMDLGKRSLGTLTDPVVADGNTIHNCRHALLYVVNSNYVDVRNNVIYNINSLRFWDDIPPGDPGNCLKVGDERADEYDSSNYLSFYNNVAYNGDRVFSIGQAMKNKRKGNPTPLPRVGIYIGYNTFIAGPFSHKTTVSVTGDNSGVFENNITLNERAPKDNDAMVSTNPGSMTVRRNAWSEAVPDHWGNSGNVVASGVDMKLFKPNHAPTGSGFRYYYTYEEYAAGYSDTFDPANYRIALGTSALIDAATTRTKAGNFWPPIYPFQYDRLGAGRSSPGDMGAYEYGGVVADGITADFTASATSGAAPLSVTFTDASTTSGSAAVDAWSWDFGNGTTAATEGPHTRVYATPGVYTVTLSARDVSLGIADTATATITVTQGVVSGSAMDAVRVALPTTTGDFSITFTLGGLAPDLVLFYLSNATVTATKTDHALLCSGAAGAGAQWAAAIYGKDNVGTTVSRSYFAEDACLLAIDESGVTARAAWASFGANRATINISDAFPAGYLLTAIAFYDPAHQVAVGTASMSNDSAIYAGFTPDMLIIGSTQQAATNTLRNGAHLLLGAMGDRLRAAPGAVQGVLPAFFTRNNVDTSITKAALRRSETGTPSTDEVLKLVPQPNGVGFDKSQAGGMHGLIGWAAMKLGGLNQAVYYGTTPHATGVVAYTTEAATSVGTEEDPDPTYETITPAMLIMAGLPAEATGQPQELDSFTWAVVDSTATYGYICASRHDVGTSDAWVRATSNFVIRDGSDTVLASGYVSLTATGFSIDWVTVSATEKYSFYVLALRGVAAPTGPIAGFIFDVGDDGVVQFTDTSTENGSAITAWAWDFGDGNTSTEADPEHEYDGGGAYTVTLTVTNDNGSDSVTRVVSIESNEPLIIPIGPYDPRSVTNYTVNKLYGDEGDPNFMRVEHALDLDGVNIDISPADTTTARAGKLRIVADIAGGRLKLILPNGTVEYLSFD